MTTATRIPLSTPWWRLPIVWLVIALPLASVVGGFAMLHVAWRGADLVMAEPPQVAAPGNAAPAMKARNHAATGVR